MLQKRKPKLGIVALSFPGFNFGEELSAGKFDEASSSLNKEYDVVTASVIVSTTNDAQKIGIEFDEQNIDCIVAVVTTFIPDYFVIDILMKCDKPVFLWIIEREVNCIALVSGPLICASLVNLGYDFEIGAGEINDEHILKKLKSFADAAMIRNLLSNAQVGYTGGKPSVMFSMAADEFVIKEKLGVSIKNFPIEEFYDIAEHIDDEKVKKTWKEIKEKVGLIKADEIDGIVSVTNYLAVKELISKYGLDAISINCFPLLKAKICLAVALLNDELIGAGCEGDLHATIMMYIIEQLTGKAAFNGDFLKMYTDKNEIMFSHCGAGGFSLAADSKDICLCASAETNDGIGVIYNTEMQGEVTLINLMTEPGGLRMAAMSGTRSIEDSGYCGNPLRLKFKTNVRDVLQNISKCGAGHHWVGMEGDYIECFKTLSSFLKIPMTIVGV